MNNTELQRIKQRYNIVGNCNTLNRALDIALQVASTDLSVLIIGESGVGKEAIPRIIHDNSPRKREKYFAINCGSIPEGTIDSELFGHEKGSFTGAIGESAGYFGTANKGTIFLDEVGELPLATQAKLLRVLESGEYIRVGGQEIRKTDVRIVAATNVNMRKAVSEGKFREDLFYRLNTIPIQMPPLRDRGEDILLLFRLFAMQMAEKYRLPKITLADDAKQIMLHYKWPGNVRQLKNITEQMSILSEQREITAEMLTQFIPRDPESTQLAIVPGGGKHSFESERDLLYKILYELRGNVSDLRRDLNTVRKQLEETRALDRAHAFDSLSGESTGNLPVSAKPITPVSAPVSQIEYAEAEEISEPETLNLSDIGRQLVEKALERNNGNRKKQPKNWESATELFTEESNNMVWTILNRLGKPCLICFVSILCLASCSVSYKFNGASIDYTKVKSIQIADFPIRATYVWGPMAPMFNNRLKDIFANHTRLEQVKRNGDMKIEGEITQYQQRNKSVSSEGYSAQTELSMTVNVRFTNNTNHNEDFERQFTATATYETTESLNSVQERLVEQMVKDLTEQIFNATVANW